MNSQRAEVRIGTSGWHYADWRGRFYPESLPTGAWLAWYAEAFDCVELDHTFYRLPGEATLRRWADQVPLTFRFAVKAPRTITHLRRLRDASVSVDTFLARARVLGERLGPILWQLRPDMPIDLGLLRTFLATLPRDLTHAFEFRHRSWFVQPVYDLLASRHSPLVIWHAGAFDSPPVLTAPLVYLRFHGPVPNPGYPPQRLDAEARRIATWADEGHPVWGFFSNDTAGHAVIDAQVLRRLLGQEAPARALEPA